MRKLTDKIRTKIAGRVTEACSTSFQSQGVPSIEEIYHQLVEPPQIELGDLALGCFLLAKGYKKSPILIAQELKSKIQTDEWLQDVRAVGPYLNFSLSPQAFGEDLLLDMIKGDYFCHPLMENTPRIMIEFSQPNTHKEIHVGHMRNACLGDCLVRVMRYAGYEVISSTFPGDEGTHVAKCLWYLKFHYQGDFPVGEGRGEWLGRIYTKAHLKLEDEEGTPSEEQNKRQLTEILMQLSAQEGEYYELWKETRQWSIDLMQRVYSWAQIEFDRWYWESEVSAASVEYVKDLFHRGLLQMSEGAIGLDLSQDNLGFCLLLKSDGTGLYATKDLEVARRKFQDFKIDKSIYVVDVRQSLHFKQVFRVLERLGFPQAKDCLHLSYNFVELPDGAMSSRKGNIVPIFDLIHEMKAVVKSRYLSRYVGIWTPEEIDLVSVQVAQGAIKYGMVKMDTSKRIVFDMLEWLKIEGDSGPFIQYSAARINSLARKYGLSELEKTKWSLLTHPSERSLCQSLVNFNGTMATAAESFRPNIICTYLYDLAKRFNYFYHECSIGQAGSEDLKKARMALSLCVGKALKNGLMILGIPTPDRM